MVPWLLLVSASCLLLLAFCPVPGGTLSPSSALVPDKDLLLLPQAARRVAKDGVVVLALFNAGYLDLLLNWKASVDRLNISNYVIVPTDIKAAQELTFLGLDWAYDPAVGLGDQSTSEAANFPINKEDPMYKLWNVVVHKKAAYVRAILALGLDVVVTDVDMVYLKDPLPILSDKTVDLFFTDDSEVEGQPPQFLCGGFWLGRSNNHTMEFVDSVLRCEQRGGREQPCINTWYFDLLKKKGSPGSAKVQVLAQNDFPSGALYFNTFWTTTKDKQRVKVRPDPYIVHDNYIIGHSTKVTRLKQHGLLLVDTEELEKKMANFSFNPNITTHEQLLSQAELDAHSDTVENYCHTACQLPA